VEVWVLSVIARQRGGGRELYEAQRDKESFHTFPKERWWAPEENAPLPKREGRGTGKKNITGRGVLKPGKRVQGIFRKPEKAEAGGGHQDGEKHLTGTGPKIRTGIAPAHALPPES